jgi:predicted DNA-binding antitoxin AbrB/MazE fold protein
MSSWYNCGVFNMSRTIEAIYEDGIFKPLAPVNLPEGTRVRIETQESGTESDKQIFDDLVEEGATPDEAKRILANFRLLWSSYDTLSGEQKELLDQTRLDQERFFNHSK